MKNQRSSRHLSKISQRGEKAMIDRLVRVVRPIAAAPVASDHSPFTETGLAIEDQVRKTWRPNTAAGLAMF